MGADKEWFEIIMKQANGSLMTALENQIQADIGGTREKANRVANHILDILDIANENKEQEIRNKAIDEFAEALKERLKGMQMVELQGEDVCPCAETGEECPYINQDIGCQYCAREQTIKDIDEIAEQMKGEQNEGLQ